MDSLPVETATILNGSTCYKKAEPAFRRLRHLESFFEDSIQNRTEIWLKISRARVPRFLLFYLPGTGLQQRLSLFILHFPIFGTVSY